VKQRKISNDQSDKSISSHEKIKIQNRLPLVESVSKKRPHAIGDEEDDEGMKRLPKKRPRLDGNEDDYKDE
jgi:hypothetical protein